MFGVVTLGYCSGYWFWVLDGFVAAWYRYYGVGLLIVVVLVVYWILCWASRFDVDNFGFGVKVDLVGCVAL